MRTLGTILGAAVLATALVGCHAKPRGRAKVVVSVFPLYDLTRRIAGPDVDVELVLPQGTSLAGWQPAADVRAKAAGANMIVSIGLGLDPWMEGVAATRAPKARWLKAGDRVPTIAGPDGTVDPFVWMDPERARLLVTAIAEDMARTDSPHATAIRERAAALDGEVGALDAELEKRVGAWPSHDVASVPSSMAYFADRYGLHAGSASGHLAPGVGTADAAIRASPEPDVDPLGGAASVRTYEDLIRSSAAAMERARP